VTPRCLIVDDNRSFLNAACMLLRREGLAVEAVATTSAEALRHAEALRPEIVLVDISLGDESGFDLARRLVASEGGDEAAVVLISTRAESELGDLIAESPALGFVSKADLSASAILRIVRGGRA
jgi:DNA-binding response OmpR family regulator